MEDPQHDLPQRTGPLRTAGSWQHPVATTHQCRAKFFAFVGFLGGTSAGGNVHRDLPPKNMEGCPSSFPLANPICWGSKADPLFSCGRPRPSHPTVTIKPSVCVGVNRCIPSHDAGRYSTPKKLLATRIPNKVSENTSRRYFANQPSGTSIINYIPMCLMGTTLMHDD